MYFGVSQLLDIRALQTFAQGMTAKLLCLVQHLALITLAECGWQQGEMSIDFEL